MFLFEGRHVPLRSDWVPQKDWVASPAVMSASGACLPAVFLKGEYL